MLRSVQQQPFCMPVNIFGKEMTVYGGPYRDRPDSMIGVKMAKEIDLPCAVDIPTEDFDVPAVNDMAAGLVKTLRLMSVGSQIYVGCMGGIGRTGLFMACLQKVTLSQPKIPLFGGFLWDEPEGSGDSAIAHVRKHYKPHALETEGQKQFVRDFPALSIAKAMYYRFH